MKKRFLSMLVLLAAVVSGTMAADGIECSASDLGKVLCTDGSIYAKVSDVPTGKTAVAMIAYIDMENKNGLALALSDEGSMTWSDAITACEGKSAVAGGTWVLPSKEQWEAMGAVESGAATATALRDGFSSVDGTNMESGAYWSSTANSTDDNKAWRYNFTTGFYWENNVNKTVNNYVRACLTFNILVAPPTYSVTMAEGTEDADKWTVKAGEGEYQELPLEGVAAGTAVSVKYNGEKKVKSVKAVKKAAANPKLGDLFYSDGTFSTELEAGKTPIGVIAYLDKEGTDDDGITEKSNGAGHGLVLCLKNAASNVAWSTNTSSQAYTGNAFVTDVAGLKRSTGVSGYSATAALATDATTYPAAAAAKNYTGLTAPTSTTGWFLPSAQQWVKMIEGLGGLDDGAPSINEDYFDNNHEGADKWENAFKKAGDGKYDSMTSAYLLYWSSSEYDVGYAVFLAVDARSAGTNRGFAWLSYGKDQMDPIILVRPVLAF